MKNISIILSVLFLILFSSCEENNIDTYFGDDYIQFVTSKNIVKNLVCNFVYDDETVEKDTMYLPVQILGNFNINERTIAIEQVTNETDDYFQAEEGKQFVKFDNALTKNSLVFDGDNTQVKIPIILLRDPSLKKYIYELTIALMPTESFKIGDLSLIHI